MNVVFGKCSQALNYATETKSFGIFYSKEGREDHSVHTHECCEILFCLSDGKNFLIDDKVYNVHRGDLFVINHFEAHKITYNPDCVAERYTVEIHPEFIFSASTKDTDLSQCFYLRNEENSNCVKLDENNINYLKEIFKSLSKEYIYGDDVIKQSLMCQLLAFTNERFLVGQSQTVQQQNMVLKQTIQYINDHLSEDLRLDAIAKNSYISVNQLCKVFKATLGTTVTRYIIGKRISHAKKLLKSGCSVSETAFLCGFGDYSNFIRSFTQNVGISPGKYKKNG
jgi:AraC-like DNA-binding protein